MHACHVCPCKCTGVHINDHVNVFGVQSSAVQCRYAVGWPPRLTSWLCQHHHHVSTTTSAPPCQHLAELHHHIDDVFHQIRGWAPRCKTHHRCRALRLRYVGAPRGPLHEVTVFLFLFFFYADMHSMLMVLFCIRRCSQSIIGAPRFRVD